MKRWVKYHAPAVFWAVLVFTVSSLPKLKSPSLGIPFSDKIFHGSEYLVLSMLTLRSLAASRGLNGRTVLLAMAVCTVFGILDELHQSFVPGRDCNAGDMLADIAGSALGILFCGRHLAVRRRSVPNDS